VNEPGATPLTESNGRGLINSQK